MGSAIKSEATTPGGDIHTLSSHLSAALRNSIMITDDTDGDHGVRLQKDWMTGKVLK